MKELTAVIPRFTFSSAASRVGVALAINSSVFFLVFLIAYCLTVVLGTGQGFVITALKGRIGMKLPLTSDQCFLLGLGYYTVFSCGSVLRQRGYPTFAPTLGCPAFICTTLGYWTVAFMAYPASYRGALRRTRV